MKHSVSEVHKKQVIRIIFDDMPDFGAQDNIISDFIDWQPLYDLFILGDNIIVIIEIAGVDVKDFSIYVCREYMIIDGLRKSPSGVSSNCCTFHNFEIPYGKFNRRIDFPVPIEPKQYQYDIDNGILTLKYPILKERIIPIEEE